MLSYRINSYNVYLRLNKLIIVGDNMKCYEKIFIPKDLYGCDTNKDIYIILQSLLDNNNIDIIANEYCNNSNIILYIKPIDHSIYLLEKNDNDNNDDILNYDNNDDILNYDNEDIDEIKLFCGLIIIFTVLNFLTYILL
jgi:hypothetical protein